MQPKATEVEKDGLSIGALSRATGISIHSLRMWERRYGSPQSYRRSSGHRRYPFSEVQRLRAVARALAAGFRAGEVVGASIEEIDEMLERGAKKSSRGNGKRRRLETNAEILDKVERWIEATRNFDETYLTTEFQRGWANLGALTFLVDRLMPFMKALGDGWQTGTLSIAQEHFASQRIIDFLSSKWRLVNELTSGSTVVLATLPRDLHTIGLQMAATVTAIAEQRVLFLGPEVPAEEIVEVAHRANASVVGISVSTSVPSRFSTANLSTIREKLPKNVEVVCGGAGAPTQVEGIHDFKSLTAYYEWLTQTYKAGKPSQN